MLGPLGSAQIDLGWCTLQVELKFVLYLAATAPSNWRGRFRNVLIDRRVVDRAVSIIQRFPGYIKNDLVGLWEDSRFEKYVRSDEAESLSRLMTERSSQFSDLATLSDRVFLLSEMIFHGPRWLEVDKARQVFNKLLFTPGKGQEGWLHFIRTTLLPKKKRGRPRNSEYDRIFQMRESDPLKLSYGKLARQTASFDSSHPEITRNRLRAALAQRRKSPKREDIGNEIVDSNSRAAQVLVAFSLAGDSNKFSI
jgi:hypothetical protein